MSQPIEHAWHIYHDQLVSLLIGSIESRQGFIRKCKSPEEVELRLRLLKLVHGKLPGAVLVAGDTYDKAEAARAKTWEAAMAAYEKVMAAYDKASDAYQKAMADHRTEIEALHAEECPDCPWNGKTIFPETEGGVQ